MLFLLLLTGCVKDKIKDINVNYTGTLAFPVAQVGFTLEEALDDDSLFVVDSENAIELIYRDENFFRLSASEFLDDITGDLVEEQTESFNVNPVLLDDYLVESSTTFGNIVDGFDDMSLQDFFEQNDGASLAIPAFSENLGTVLSVPAYDDFTYLEIESGTLRITTTNSLFFQIENLGVTIIDNADQNVVGTVVFSQIDIGETATEELDLAGKTVGNDFRLELGQFETSGTGSTPVTIDLASVLFVTAEIVDVVISAGQVTLPAGTYAEGDFLFDIDLDEGERIYKIELDYASVNYSLTSDLEAAFDFRMSFPDVLRNGVPVEETITVPPTSGTPLTGTLDFSNTIWQLDKDADQPYNRLRVMYVIELPNGTIDQVNFSTDDQVDFQITLEDLEPELVEGYFGQKIETIEPGEIDLGFDFDIFDETSSALFFDNPAIWVNVRNSFGVPLSLDFDATAFGSFGGQSTLNPPSPLNINYPDAGMIGETVETTFLFNKNNSNIVDMLSIYPSNIEYEGMATANPENDMGIINSVSSKSELTADAEIVMPFKFRAENLIYTEKGDAIDLDLEEGLTIDDIDSAVLKIVYQNDLPLQAKFQVNAVNFDGSEIIVIDNVQLDAATPGPSGRVDSNGVATGEVFVRLSQEQILQLDEAVENNYKISFQTPNNGQLPAAMYSDYDVELNIGMTVTFDR